MMEQTHIDKIREITRGNMLIREPMKKHTTFGIGGDASCYLYPEDREDLKNILRYANENYLDTFFTGSGSNLLVSDDGFDGIVISLSKSFKKMTIASNFSITVEAGVMLGNMVKNAIRRGICGLESLSGVPGTVGGALIMNAGAYGQEISKYFMSALVICRDGYEKHYQREEIDFSYRYSSFKNDQILIEATFQCQTGEPTKIRAMKEIVSAKRKGSQPLKYRSAGSIFKNPPGKAAGYLIDQAGLKGTQVGDAEISTKHANFIVNRGNARAEDVIELIRLIKNIVNKRFNISLQLEVKLLGFNDPIMTEFGYA